MSTQFLVILDICNLKKVKSLKDNEGVLVIYHSISSHHILQTYGQNYPEQAVISRFSEFAEVRSLVFQKPIALTKHIECITSLPHSPDLT